MEPSRSNRMKEAGAVRECSVKTMPENRNSTAIYISSLEHLADEFKRLDLLLQRQVGKQQRPGTGSLEQFQGLVISEEEITALFAGEQLAEAIFTQASDGHEDQPWDDALYALDFKIQQRRDASRKQGLSLPLSTLTQLFHLSPFEERCLIICLAPEIDRRYEKVYAFLQDDVTRKRPSVDLILHLLCPTLPDKLAARSAFAPTAPLLRHRLLQMDDSGANIPTPLISRFLKLDDRIVDFLIESDSIDGRLSRGVEYLFGAPASESALYAQNTQGTQNVQDTQDEKKRIQTYLSELDQTGTDQCVMFSLVGPYGTGRKSLAQWINQQQGLPLLVADSSMLFDGSVPFGEMVRLLCREAVLQPAAVCIENFEYLLSDDSTARNNLKVLCHELESSCPLVFLIGSRSWKPQTWLKRSRFVELACSVPDETTRKQLWTSHLNACKDTFGQEK